MTALINDSKPKIDKHFKLRKCFDNNEIEVVSQIIDDGHLSSFVGAPGKYFYGGKYVKECEEKFAKLADAKYAITVNSWTTGLQTIIGSLGIGPGDEVICPPWTMSASATCILFYGGIPVFVDIDKNSFNLDPHKLEEAITEKTKAIMLVHLFGNPCDMEPILKIADKYNLKVIEDAAQSPGAIVNNKRVGCIGDIGGFSLNYHKHIHSGEGGVIVTNSKDLYEKCCAIRNHGENVADDFTDITNIIGSNYRMSEIHAAIASCQVDKLEVILEHRKNLGIYAINALSKFKFLSLPKINWEKDSHTFYMLAIKYYEDKLGIKRNTFIRAVNAEFPSPKSWDSLPFAEAYVQPLYWSRIYKEKTAIGKDGFPFNLTKINYDDVKCHNCEDLHLNKIILSPLIRENIEESDIDNLVSVINYVVDNIELYKEWEKSNATEEIFDPGVAIDKNEI